MVEISLAPMLKITSPQFRLLSRKISKTTILFTEMIVSAAVVHASLERLMEILGRPNPRTVVQIGGADPEETAEAVKRLAGIGWESFNLNCGCPSSRVQAGRFGAVLMKDPVGVAAVINSVYRTTGHVLSLKIRTGVDEFDTFAFLEGFVEYISTHTPCSRFYVHARKCWLSGVSPRQNRTIPPLNYPAVYSLKTRFPHLFIALNGGIGENGLEVIGNLDGLMIGRRAVDNIAVFRHFEHLSSRAADICAEERTDSKKSYCDATNKISRGDIELNRIADIGKIPENVFSMKDAVRLYLEEACEFTCSRAKILIPLNNLQKGKPNNKQFRKTLAEMIHSNVTLEDVYRNIEGFMD